MQGSFANRLLLHGVLALQLRCTLDAGSILKDRNWQLRESRSASNTGSCHCWQRSISGADGRWFRRDEGIARIRQSLAIATATIQCRLFELYLAAAYWQMGRAEEGLSMVETSLAKMSNAGESYHIIPELYLLRGELLLMQKSHEVEAEQCAYRAIEIAHRNSDKTAELRATTSLARLLAKQGRREEAQAMLADIYCWFTEGFDTADLQDAKALLDQLAD
jgi:tetratricopeptide (TPR) repeat protein